VALDNPELHEARVRSACEIEMFRIGHVSTHLGLVADFPGAAAGKAYLAGALPAQVAPLADRLAAVADRYGKLLAQSLNISPLVVDPVLLLGAPVDVQPMAGA